MRKTTKNIKLNKLISLILLPLLIAGYKEKEEATNDSTIYTVTFDALEGSLSDNSKKSIPQVKEGNII